MKFVNLTPHEINIVGVMRIPPEEIPARVSVTQTGNGNIDGVPIFRNVFGEVENLPPKTKGICYIVSAMVAGHPSCRERNDLFAPTNLVRDENGTIIGAGGLCGV